MKRITYDDISRMTGLSKGTISKVLNKKPGVSPESRKKVLDACRKLHYTPNLLAKGLRSRKTHSLGLIVPDITNSFFSEFARAVMDYAQKKEYSVFLADSFESPDEEEKLVRHLLSHQVDGLIVVPSGVFPNYLSVLSKPVVFADRFVPNARYVVWSDNYGAGFEGMKYLIERGKRRILILSGPVQFKTNETRLRGCLDALSKFGSNSVSYEIKYLQSVSVESAQSLTESLLRDTFPFDAIFAFSDVIAIGFLTASKGRVAIPEQVGVLGFDGIKDSAIVNPPLTTLQQDIRGLGFESVKMLIDIIEGREVVSSKVATIPVKLVERSSV